MISTTQTVVASGKTFDVKSQFKSRGFKFCPIEKTWTFSGTHVVSPMGQAGWSDDAGNFKFSDDQIFAWRRQGVEITIE